MSNYLPSLHITGNNLKRYSFLSYQFSSHIPSTNMRYFERFIYFEIKINTRKKKKLKFSSSYRFDNRTTTYSLNYVGMCNTHICEHSFQCNKIPM